MKHRYPKPEVNRCTHDTDASYWVNEYVDDWGTTVHGHWEYERKSTNEDLDIGRFKCTQCGQVGYYTGQWRDFFEKGTPCAGSEKVKRDGSNR